MHRKPACPPRIGYNAHRLQRSNTHPHVHRGQFSRSVREQQRIERRAIQTESRLYCDPLWEHNLPPRPHPPRPSRPGQLVFRGPVHFARQSSIFLSACPAWCIFSRLYPSTTAHNPEPIPRRQNGAAANSQRHVPSPIIHELLQHDCGLPATPTARAQVISVTETYILFMEREPHGPVHSAVTPAPA
jgi:hypothetical protein